LGEFDALDLGTLVVKEAIQRAGIAPELVEMVSLGCIVPAGLGLVPAKTVVSRAGLGHRVVSRAVNAACGASMDAMVISCDSIQLGVTSVTVAGGMESRSNAPYLFGPKFRVKTEHYQRGERVKVERGGAYRFNLSENVEEQLKGAEMKDATAYDGLFWPGQKKFMREYALEFAKKHGYKAPLINEYAEQSYRKAEKATAEGWFAPEIVPCKEAAKDDILTAEERQRILEKDPEDPASAYNASVPADAGAALVLLSGEKARELGVQPVARILAYARSDCDPKDYLGEPVAAVEELIGALRANGYYERFPIIEANEAFGIQLPFYEQSFPGLEINVHGGAVALGHPFGAAGARITTTLLYAMQRYGHPRGIATMCYGGGAYAFAVEWVE
jgi:acetyl-CoA C-acetyltransferase